jgi:O-antigen/teichoic acid export membrane protein
MLLLRRSMRNEDRVESVKAGMVRGAAWNVAIRIVDRSIGMVSIAILARLLIPADFGVVALGSSFAGLLALLTAFGFDLWLIQNPRAERRHFDTVWTFKVLFGLATAALLALPAHHIARFYEEPRLAPVMLGLAVARAISSFDNVGLVWFRKDMAFDREFRFSLAKRLLTTFVATIPFALVWRDYRALVWGTIAGSCFGLALSYTMQPYRPRLSFAATRELFGFSRWLQLANLTTFVSRGPPTSSSARSRDPQRSAATPSRESWGNSRHPRSPCWSIGACFPATPGLPGTGRC